MNRVEVSVYNEATGFVITSKNHGGRDFDGIDGTDREWHQAVADGILLPVALVQDDSLTIRVVVDDALTAEESSQWVDHWSGRLIVADGILTITGGSEYLWGEDSEEYTRYIPLPPGEYRADFYTYIPGVNGWYALESVPASADSFGGGMEPLGAYFRRTRPGETVPLWLQGDGVDDPSVYLDFLLQLTPVHRLSPGESIPPAPIATSGDEQGWIGQAVAPRKPALCPTGLIAADTETDG